MDTRKLIAVLLIAIGAMALAYGGFSFTKQTHTADIGALHLSVDEKQRVNLPIWLGVGVLLVGGVLLIGKR